MHHYVIYLTNEERLNHKVSARAESIGMLLQRCMRQVSAAHEQPINQHQGTKKYLSDVGQVERTLCTY